jgi:hypothetical protein
LFKWWPLLELSWAQRFEALRVLVGLHLVWLRLKLRSIDSNLESLAAIDGLISPQGSLSSASLSLASSSPAEFLEFLNRVAWRFPWVDTCLFKSVYAFSRFRRAGCDVRLSVGVAKEKDGSLIAHAWLEDSDGNSLISDARVDHSSYTKIVSI